VRERMLRSEVDTPGLLTIYERILDGKTVKDDETNPLISVLRLSGITRADNGLLKVRSRIYKEVFDHDWVVSNMPGAELRRQRTAYKSGLKRAFAIVLALLVIGIAIALGNFYAPHTVALFNGKSSSPPAFWASSRIPVAGAKRQSGGILLHTGQADVTVMVDNFQFGRTSSSGDLRIPLPPASYDIRLEKPGFQTLKVPVNVLKDQESQISVKLEHEVVVAATFVVTGGVPGAAVRLDGKEVGQIQADGTFAHETSAGLHAVELEKTGYLTFHTQQAFAPGKKIGIEGRLLPDSTAAEADAYAAVAASTDPAQLRQFSQKYPSSKNTAQVLNRIDELEWKKVSRTDLNSLDAYLQACPMGLHANEARGLIEGLQNEQVDYVTAMKAGSSAALQAFLTKHPNSPYAEQFRQKLSQQQDKETVLSVLHRYEDAYNRRDIDGIVALWPSFPEAYKKMYRDSFRSADAPKLKLELDEPDIQGIVASVKCKETRSGAMSSSSEFTAKLIKQGDKWVIQSGPY